LVSERRTESWVTAENGKIIVMQVNGYTLGNAVVQHQVHMELIWCCWCVLISAEADWGLELEEVPLCHASPLALLFWEALVAQAHCSTFVGSQAGFWCFPWGHMLLDLSDHCSSSFQMALCRAGLVLSDFASLGGDTVGQ